MIGALKKGYLIHVVLYIQGQRLFFRHSEYHKNEDNLTLADGKSKITFLKSIKGQMENRAYLAAGFLC